jgi:hypothetical protein
MEPLKSTSSECTGPGLACDEWIRLCLCLMFCLPSPLGSVYLSTHSISRPRPCPVRQAPQTTRLHIPGLASTTSSSSSSARRRRRRPCAALRT